MIAHNCLVPVAAVMIAVTLLAQQPQVPLVSARRAALQAKFEELLSSEQEARRTTSS
jgi:hypothetical protein